MPIHTPSPHRFLASRPSSTQPKTKSKLQSNLRHGFTAQTPKPTFSSQTNTKTQTVTPARRFVIAPVQSASGGGSHRIEDEAWEQTQAQQIPRAKPARKLKRVESIEEGSQSSPSRPQESENFESDVTESIEQPSTHGGYTGGEHENGDEEDEDTEMLFEAPYSSPNANKRRRLSPAEPTSPTRPLSAISTFAIPQQPPQTPAPVLNTHRFLTPAPRTPQLFQSIPPSTTANATTPGPSRPHFLPPPQKFSPPKLLTPLPETFSPSRKGQKYIPGGLASSMQAWIVETANSGYAMQTRDAVIWGREKEDGVKIKVRVSGIRSGRGQREGEEAVECYSGGVVFVSGAAEAGAGSSNGYASRVVGDEVVRVMLTGQGGARGAGGVTVGVGNLLRVRAPTWDVDIGGEKWIVGVDWVVL